MIAGPGSVDRGAEEVPRLGAAATTLSGAVEPMALGGNVQAQCRGGSDPSQFKPVLRRDEHRLQSTAGKLAERGRRPLKRVSPPSTRDEIDGLLSSERDSLNLGGGGRITTRLDCETAGAHGRAFRDPLRPA